MMTKSKNPEAVPAGAPPASAVAGARIASPEQRRGRRAAVWATLLAAALVVVALFYVAGLFSAL